MCKSFRWTWSSKNCWKGFTPIWCGHDFEYGRTTSSFCSCCLRAQKIIDIFSKLSIWIVLGWFYYFMKVIKLTVLLPYLLLKTNILLKKLQAMHKLKPMLQPKKLTENVRHNALRVQQAVARAGVLNRRQLLTLSLRKFSLEAHLKDWKTLLNNSKLDIHPVFQYLPLP